MSIANSGNGYYEIEAPARSRVSGSSDFEDDFPSHEPSLGGQAILPLDDRPLEALEQQEIRRLLLTVGLGQFVVAVAGIALSAALGFTITGGILTGCACFLFLAVLAMYFFFRLTQQSVAKRKLLSNWSLSKAMDLLKTLMMVSIAMLIIALGTVIQGSVILGQLSSYSMPFLPYIDPYIYQSMMTFLYIGLGSANLALGAVSAVIQAIVVYRVYVSLRRLRGKTFGPEAKNGAVDVMKSLAGEKSAVSSRTTSPLPAAVNEKRSSSSAASESTVSSSIRFLETPRFKPAEIKRYSPSATSV